MKLYIAKKLNYTEADMLIERYYDGLTTVEEEKKLQQFLSQPNLPEKYRAEQAIFGYFRKEEQKNKIIFPAYLRRVAVVALILTTAFTVQNLIAGRSNGYAIVNGKKITDKTEIKTMAMNSLREISSTNNEVEDGLNAINNNEIVEQQLAVFNEPMDLK